MTHSPVMKAAFDPLFNKSCQRNILLRAAILFCSLVPAAFPLSAQIQPLTRPVNLAFLARRAEVIVQGRVVQARYEGLPNYPHIRTVVVTLEVERMLRGPEGSRYTFRQILLGSPGRGPKSVYASGQRMLLFLPAPSQHGLSSPIGHVQGRFHITRDPRGAELISNEMGNAGLFKGVAADAERVGARLTAEQSETASTPRGPVRLTDFTDLLKHLMLLPRTE